MPGRAFFCLRLCPPEFAGYLKNDGGMEVLRRQDAHAHLARTA